MKNSLYFLDMIKKRVKKLTRKKWEPTRVQLERAWTWKKRGRTNKFIAEKLGSTLSKYQKVLSIFRLYYVQKEKEDKHKSDTRKYVSTKNVSDIIAAKGKNYKAGERKLEIKDIDLEILRSYVICGFSKEKIAGFLGITRGTLYTYSKEFPHIKHILEHAQKEATAGVMQSLLMMTKDRMVDDTAVASYLGDISTKKIKKSVPASFPAVKHYLANTLGWGSEPRKETANNKGAILQMLDKMANNDEGEDDAEEKETDD